MSLTSPAALLGGLGVGLGLAVGASGDPGPHPAPREAEASQGPAHAEHAPGAESPPLRWTATPTVAEPGEPTVVRLRLALEEGYKVWREDVSVAVLDAPEGFAAGAVALPDGHWVRDPDLGLRRQRYHGAIDVGLPVVVPEGAEGLLRVALHTEVRTCNAQRCFGNWSQDVDVWVQVAADGALPR